MTKPNDFPLIISPNLGCPIIVSIKELKTIPLIIAGRYDDSAVPLKGDFAGTLYLRPSYPEDGTAKDIPLSIQSNPEEIPDWNLLSNFSNIEDTRNIINSELHYNVLGKTTCYWKIAVSMDPEVYKTLLRKKGEKCLPTLYDLVYKDESGKWERVNYHSIQFVESVEGKCNFIHVADPHTAKRNDEILDEVLKVKHSRSRKDIEDNYINFNENMREFIRKANNMADAGELDFVVINGDLVDFSFHGWEDETNPDENNWKTFINIITGAGKEKERCNIGLKVAAFTSTGNHDWRLHPYNPNLGKYNETFGLEKEELKHYKYKSFDSSEYPKDDRAKLSKELTSQALKKLNLNAFTFIDKWKVWLSKYLSSRVATLVVSVLSILGIAEEAKWAKLREYVGTLIGLGIPLFIGLVMWGIKYALRKTTDMLIDNPLHAEASALHYYLKHINPYLDYAFQYGEHSFIVMDTGADVFVGQLLDKAEIKYIKRMSFEDNIFGGSPDSRAFDSEQAYYNWSQIVWLEKVMTAISKKRDDKSKIFAFLHASPINPPDTDSFDLIQDKLRESNRKNIPVWIPEYECNMTYGTINHYLSQFFYLCMGYRESELVKQNLTSKLWQTVKHFFCRCWWCKNRNNSPIPHDPLIEVVKYYLKQFCALCKSLVHKLWQAAKLILSYFFHLFSLCWLCCRKNKLVRQGSVPKPWQIVIHYLRQYFCLSEGESINPELRQVNIVFSGHAHRNIEFRIEKDTNHEIRIYMDEYSDPKKTYEWWGSSPVIVQTASCTVHGRLDKVPPYYRKVAINESGHITDFQVRDRNGIIPLNEAECSKS